MKPYLILCLNLLLVTTGGCVGNSAQEPPQEAQLCGTIAGLTCSDGQYCRMEPAGKCRIADADGVCETRPEACTEEYNPVCGCDDKTYSNACHAAMEGISVLHSGECEAAPTN